MSILSKIGNGRLVYGWNKTQIDQEITKGRLNSRDLTLLRDSNEIYAFGQTWGGKSPDKAKLDGYPLSTLPRQYRTVSNPMFNGMDNPRGKDLGIQWPFSPPDVPMPPIQSNNSLYFLGTNDDGASYKYILPAKDSDIGEGTRVSLAAASLGLYSTLSGRLVTCGDKGCLGSTGEGVEFYNYKDNTWTTISENTAGTLHGILFAIKNQVLFHTFNPYFDITNNLFTGELVIMDQQLGITNRYMLVKYLITIDFSTGSLTLTKLDSRNEPSSAPDFDQFHDSLVLDVLGKIAYVFHKDTPNTSFNIEAYDLENFNILYMITVGVIIPTGLTPRWDLHSRNSSGFMYGGYPIIGGQFMYDPIVSIINQLHSVDSGSNEVFPIWEEEGLGELTISSSDSYPYNFFLKIFSIHRDVLNLPITSEDTIVSAIQKLGYAVEENKVISTDLWKELEGVNNAMTELEIVSQ